MDAVAFLARLRGRLRRTVALAGAARLAGVLVAGTAAALVIDRVWFLPGWLRLGLLLTLLAAAAIIVWRRLLRPLRTPLSDRDLATFAERHLPALDGRLFAAIDGIPLGTTEAATLAATLPQGCERTLVPARRLPRGLAIAGSLLLAAIVSAAWAPQFWNDGLKRLALPLSDADWTRTAALSGRVERPVVATDEQVVIELSRARGAPAPVQLAWDDGHGSAGRRQLSGLDGPWRQALALTPGGYHIRAWSGDSHAVHLTALVVDRPRLASVEAVLIPPAYSGLPEQRLSTAACQALAGSRLGFRASFALPPGRTLGSAAARFAEQPLVLAHGDAGWDGSIAIRMPGELVLDGSDTDGIALNPPARFPITVEPDRPPQVSLSGPTPDELVGPKARVAVTIEATDDLGLASVQLSAQAGGDPRPLLDGDLGGRKAASRQATVDVASLAAAGGTITLLGRATDRNDVTGPGVGTSRPLVLKVVPDEELRREFERRIAEARDRVVQARTTLAPLLQGQGRPAEAARAAGADAARAAELADRVHRRWLENGLPEPEIAPVREAATAAGSEAPPQLAKAAAGDADSARAADRTLEKAERALDRLLAEGDLARLLAELVRQEETLIGETRTFIRDYLVKALDDAGRNRQTGLANRQRDLATRMADAERRILAGPSTLEQAKALVRSEGPSDRLGQAANDLGSAENRPRSGERQQQALTTMKRLLDLLRGGDAAADLARRLGELAERQERLAEAIPRGADAGEATREQARLREETQRLAGDMKDLKLQAPMGAAVGAQQGAEQGLAQNDRPGAARDADTAAQLLREVQRQLDPRAQPQDQGKDQGKSQADVLALLRSLLDQQGKVLADSLPIQRRLGEDAPDFAATRDLGLVAQLQDDILLRLTEEGIKPLQDHPIALSALKRVEIAMRAVLTHLKTPALGTRGLRLERIALHELQRLLEVAENLPKPQQGDGGGGDGKGGGNQAPFPPAAELALLIARQDEIAALTSGGRPTDLAAMQGELAGLVDFLHGQTRPGSRPEVLLARAVRGTGSATELLKQGERGAETRHHQLAAREALRQILLEAKGNQGGSSGKKPPPQQPHAPQAQQPPPSQPGGGSPGQSSAAGGTQAATASSAGTDVRANQDKSGLLQLPPEARERLSQARSEPMPPGALPVFERYLEKLEEK